MEESPYFVTYKALLCLSAGSSQGGGKASGETAEGKRGRGQTEEDNC